MATLAQMENALVKAHQAGDEKAARALAAAIKAERAKGVPKPMRSGGFFDKADATVRGMADTLTLGFADEMAAGAYAPIGAAVDAAKGNGFDLGRAYNRQLGRERATDRYDEQNAPVARGVGQVGGAVVLPGAALSNSARLGTRVAVNAAQGGAYGFGSGEGGVGNRAENAAKMAAVTAAGGEVGRAVVKGAGGLLRGATRSPEVERLRQAGVRLTLGQQLGGRAKAVEDRMSGLPLAGGPIREARKEGMTSVMRAAGNKALEPIGGAVSPGAVTGREIADDAMVQAGDAYDAALRGMRAQADTKLSVTISNLRANPTVAELIDDEVIPRMGANGELDGVAIQEIKEVLDAEAKKWGMAPGGRRTEKALKAARDAILDTVERQAPASAAAYRKARKAYGMAKTVAKASEKSTSDGIATPRQIGMAVREGARRFGPRDAYARGNAGPMQQLTDDAASIMPATVPDPGTAGQLVFADLLRRPVRSAGMLGVGALYSPLLQDAAAATLFSRPLMMRQAGQGLGQIAAPLGGGLGLMGATQFVGN